MSAKISDYKDSIYIRDYTHDIAPQTDLLKRAAVAALPFFSLNPFLRYPISLVMGSLRAWNIDTDTKEALIQKTIAIVALVASIAQHRGGMALSTAQDILLEIKTMQNQTTWEETSKSTIKILNHLAYLALLSRGGLELSLISFATQTLINLIQSRDEFKQDRWIEGCASLLMAGIRANQTHTQYEQLKRNWEIAEAIKNIHVGELHEKWRFPSDHLPIGVEVNGVRIISWNVLNNIYMEWVTDQDSQGLKGSLISDLDIVIDEKSGLTQRDTVVAEMVQNMMAKGHVVALQECGLPFLKYLEERVPSNWKMIRSFDWARKDQDVVLYNESKLNHCPDRSETTCSAYPSVPNRPLQNVSFTNECGDALRIINAHIPGDPALPAREEFADYVRKQHQEGSVTIAVGDNNFERDEMIAAYQKAGFSDFSLHSPWKTNIDPYTKDSKGIDHIFVAGEANSRDLQSQEILSGWHLQYTIDLLNGDTSKFYTQDELAGFMHALGERLTAPLSSMIWKKDEQ